MGSSKSPTESVDPYVLLQVDSEASEKEIRSSYRKLAKTCHPDKNTNPNSVFLFHQLTEALDCLLDPTLREDLDRKHEARREKVQREQKRDEAEKKLRRDLEDRERKFAEEERSRRRDDDRINQLRRAADKLLEEEHEHIINRLSGLGIREPEPAEEKPIIKVKWDKSGWQYSQEELLKLFSKYGAVENVVVKKSSGLIEFKCLESASIAFKAERGFDENPLSLKSFFSARTSSKYIFVRYPCMSAWPSDIEQALVQLEKFVFSKLLTQ